MPTCSRLCHSKSTLPVSMSTSWAIPSIPCRPDMIEERSVRVARRPSKRGVLRADEELVQVSPKAVARADPGYLAVRAVQDHVLAEAVAVVHTSHQVSTGLPGSSAVSPWRTRNCHTTQVVRVVDDHRSVVPVPSSKRHCNRGGVVVRCVVVTSTAAGLRSGRERKVNAFRSRG